MAHASNFHIIIIILITIPYVNFALLAQLMLYTNRQLLITVLISIRPTMENRFFRNR